MTELVHDPVSRVRYAFQRDGENLIVDCLVEAGGALPPHRHPRQVERWSVAGGQVRFRLGHTERLIGPPDGEIVVTPGAAHGLANAGDQEARLRCRVEPALRLQALLEESAAAGRRGLFTARGLPRGLAGARWAAGFLDRYRGETVFLSPPLPVQRVMIALLARDPGPDPERKEADDATQ